MPKNKAVAKSKKTAKPAPKAKSAKNTIKTGLASKLLSKVAGLKGQLKSVQLKAKNKVEAPKAKPATSKSKPVAAPKQTKTVAVKGLAAKNVINLVKTAKAASKTATIQENKSNVVEMPKKKRGKAEGTCGFSACSELSTTDGYCRLHYMMAYQATLLVNKKDAQVKLKSAVKRMSDKYPDEYMEIMKGDLTSEKSFRQALGDMDDATAQEDFDSGKAHHSVDD